MIIGLDVGGTHTDAVLLGDEGLVNEVKVLTDPSNLFETVLKALSAVAGSANPSEIKRIVLSTTLTTNAIVQNKINETAMIVSGGPGIDPEFFRTGLHYYPVSGSVDHRGREIEAIDPLEVKGIAEKIKKSGISHVGVVSKFCVRNPSHELKIYELIKDYFEKVFLGHLVSGGYLNFPRRIVTTFLNAAVYPLHKNFFKAVNCSLEKFGFKVPIRILKADGGNMNFEASIDFPGQTILSGPAASVMGATAFAKSNSETLVLDIGGTTTDMAVLVNRAPLLNPLGIEIGNYRTLIRSLETHSVGIGGDSEVTIENCNIKIGPERKGSAMAYGGPAPTPTDALFVLNKMTNGNKEKSIKGFSLIANQLGTSVENAAKMVFDRTCSMILLEAGKMINKVNSKPVYTVHEMLEGYKVKPDSILVLGGPAPYFAECLKQISDFKVLVVPKWQVANAIGAALARTTSEVALFADTEQGIAYSPGENFSKNIESNFSKQDALALAYDLLKQKALKRGANPDYLEMEAIEDLEFNMVRGFNTVGKNIRVQVQIKPGLIHGYDLMIKNLAINQR